MRRRMKIGSKFTMMVGEWPHDEELPGILAIPEDLFEKSCGWFEFLVKPSKTLFELPLNGFSVYFKCGKKRRKATVKSVLLEEVDRKFSLYGGEKYYLKILI